MVELEVEDEDDFQLVQCDCKCWRHVHKDVLEELPKKVFWTSTRRLQKKKRVWTRKRRLQKKILDKQKKATTEQTPKDQRHFVKPKHGPLHSAKTTLRRFGIQPDSKKKQPKMLERLSINVVLMGSFMSLEVRGPATICKKQWKWNALAKVKTVMPCSQMAFLKY
jgi:hypothetical protein